METPVAPSAQPKCIAQFMKVSMEMMKNEKDGKMTSDGLCDGFEGFTTHCKKADYDATDKDMKPTDDEGEMTYESILGMKKQRCDPCGKGFMELSMKLSPPPPAGGNNGCYDVKNTHTTHCEKDGATEAACAQNEGMWLTPSGTCTDGSSTGIHSPPADRRALSSRMAKFFSFSKLARRLSEMPEMTAEKCTAIDAFIAGDCKKDDFDAMEFSDCHDDDDDDDDHDASGHGNGGSGHNHGSRALGMHESAGGGSGYGYGYGEVEETVEGCYGGPDCKEAGKAHGCCDCGYGAKDSCGTSYGDPNGMWSDQCAGLCYEPPPIMGCYAAPACDAAGREHGCCDCEMGKEECDALGGYPMGLWSDGCRGLCLPCTKTLKYDTIKADLDKMKAECPA